MAEEEVQEEEKQKPPIVMIVLVIVGVLLLVGITMFGTLFATGFFDAEEETAEEAIAALEEEEEADAEALASSGPQLLELPEKEKLDTVYFKIPQSLVSNVKDSRKVMQITVQVSTHYDQQVIDNIEKHSPALISEMLNVLGGITEKDIKDSEFKQILADDLKLVMNATLEEREDFGGIENVYFVEFIIQ
ncbi:MAG: flagellar basal body-associated FliL family protein [Halieaceae bacterium]|nr:flagellar basal body-associated FliL family protein [Halieaceae bacterium]